MPKLKSGTGTVGKVKESLSPTTTATAPDGVQGALYYDSTLATTMQYGTSWKAVSAASATGGTETNATISSVSYKIHTFTSSGTFTVAGGTMTGTDALIVGGGGGSGGRHAGGGGAGGVIYNTGQSVAAGAYTITVGSGGARMAGEGQGNLGSSSTALGETGVRGGASGGYSGGCTAATYNGGSGAGASGRNCNTSHGWDSHGAGNTTQGNPNLTYGGSGTKYGHRGGNHAAAFDHQGGGGGGANAQGGHGTNDSPGAGDGGAGIQINVDGNNWYWAGGGGGNHYGDATGGGADGGDGGAGGGGGGGGGIGGHGGHGEGGGSAKNTGTSGGIHCADAGGDAGTNTGGGGGGAAGNSCYIGGAGGSGIVIIRYID